MDRVRIGSDGAARALLEEYGGFLLRVVRRRLNRKLRPKFDSLDFVQAVWASFFALPPERLAFRGPEELAAFLARLANNKVVESIRQRLCGLKYNVNRERSLDVPEDGPAAWLAAQEPSPEAIAIAREEWQRLFEALPERNHDVLVALGEGLSPRQAAQELGLSEKTVRRVIRRLRSKRSHESE